MTSGYHMLTERDRSAMRRDAQADEAASHIQAIKRAELVALTVIEAAINTYADTVSLHAGDYSGRIERHECRDAVRAIKDVLRDLSHEIRSDLDDMESGVGHYAEEG